jgi:AcrR family transcriptional regulator
MLQEEPAPTKDRVIAEAMRLFGEQGYAATTIAQIEAAAGLSPGSGALYKHFPSKADVLTEGITRLIEAGAQLRTLFETQSESADLDRLPLRDRVDVVARAGLRRLEDERDFNRILVRDLQKFPDLLARAKNNEISSNHKGLANWLSWQAEGTPNNPDRDWDAVAAVLMDATAHYWLLRDVFGGDHPTGVSTERYLNALIEVVTALLEMPQQPTARS